jgi:hypothetical protein
MNVHFFYGLTALVYLSLLNAEISKSHLETPHSVGLLWISDQAVAENSI